MNDITVTRYGSNQKDIWNIFNSGCINSLFMFDRDYMDYHSDRFIDHSLLFKKGNEIVAIFPANESEGKLVSHGGLTYGGFIVSEKMRQGVMNSCVAELIHYCKINGIDEVVYKCIPHIFGNQLFESDLYALAQAGAQVLKIEPSTVINLQSPILFTENRKRNIRKAEKNKVAIAELNDFDSFCAYIELVNDVLKKRHGVSAVHTAEEIFREPLNKPYMLSKTLSPGIF